MQKDLAKLTPEEKLRLLEQLQADADKAEEDPPWFDGKSVNQIAYCDALLAERELRCVNDRLYALEGVIDDTELRGRIASDLRPYVQTSLDKVTETILKSLKLLCIGKPILPTPDRIHLKNGTYHLDNGFSPELEWTMNRLPVDYDLEAPEPVRWKRFLSELLYPEDIITLQEFLGYCMIPSTKGQVMLMLIGSGGEGKSRIGAVLSTMFGPNMNFGDVNKLEHDRFCPADQEGKLLFIDDDMKLEALASTNIIKSIVTCEGTMDLERKGKQSYQGRMYVRLLCMGNGSLKALHDKSIGFYRRQIILQTKPRPTDRVDDPYLKEKLEAEIPGILHWCIAGLERLLSNDYRFSVSERSKNLKQDLMTEDNSIAAFLTSDGYVMFVTGMQSSTKKLYRCYQQWCEDNAEKPLASSTFSRYLSQNAEQLNIYANKNVSDGSGRYVRGYDGITVVYPSLSSTGLPEAEDDPMFPF